MRERRRRRVGARRRRRIRIGGGIAAGVAAVAIAWSVHVALGVYSDLSDAEDAARALRDAVSEGDVPRAKGLLDAYEKSSQRRCRQH